MELQPQLFRRLLAQDHPGQEGLEKFHHGGDGKIGLAFQGKAALILVQQHLGMLHRIIDPIVHIKIRIGQHLPHPAAAHIRFIPDDDGCGDGGYHGGGAFIMMADGGKDFGDLHRLRPQAAQNGRGQQRPVVGVVHPVYQIADIVEKGGDFGKLDGSVIMAQGGKDHLRRGGHPGHMGEGMLGVADGAENGVRLFDEGAHLRIVLYLFKGDIAHGNLRSREIMDTQILYPSAGLMTRKKTGCPQRTTSDR